MLNTLADDPSTYHRAVAIRIGGPLDVNALTSALRNLLQRTEVLCERFTLEDGMVIAEASRAQIAPREVEDLSDLEASAKRAELARIRDTELHRSFNLATEPPVRFHLIRLKQHQHELLMVIHHIAADEQSVVLLAEQIVAQYSAETDQRTLADVPAYRDNIPEHDELTEDRDFWRDALADLPDPVPLPYQRGRQEVATQRAERVEFAVAPDVAAIMTSLAKQEHTDVATVILAAFAVVLHRALRTADLTVGVVIGGRDPVTEQTVGPLDEAKPLRLRLPYDPTWREVIGLVRDEARLLAAHWRTPFQSLIELTGIRPNISVHPLFQVLVRADSAALESRTARGVTFIPQWLDTGRSPYDAELLMPAEAAPRSMTLRYASGLLSPDDAQSLVGLLQRTLRQMATDPDGRLSNTALVSDSERDAILYSWNNTEVDFPGHLPVHELFEQWADRTPDAPALRWEETGYSYAELDHRANQLAHLIGQLGVARETRVGLYFGYTAEWVVSALATLKAGGAYVPLDPAYPPERLTMMCRTADVAVVLGHTSMGKLPGFPADRQLLVDAEPAIDGESGQRPRIEVRPDQLAYVMFTSGSTGVPKAIGTTHRNVIRTVRGISYTRFAPGDSGVQGSNISFDATTLETWGPLLNGARLVGLRKEDLLEPRRLRRQLAGNDIDFFFLPAALMKQHVAEEPATFESLWYFHSGGEQADFRTLARIIEHGAPEHLINPYGPTEITVYSAAYRCNDLTEADQHVPIGFPLANATCYVLDQYWQPLPSGLTGELFVGGPGVSRGYLGQPAMTSEAFVPDPFAGRPGTRMYRTGDLARYRADGALEFLGRADRQVKIRGFRVEPGEIETAILRSGQVREVSVQVSTDIGGDQALVAYVVPADSGLDTTSLRDFVREQVPSYMAPGMFVPMSSLPLNPNGKLDVSALRAFRPTETGEREIAEPRTATEGRLDALVTELLAVDRISVDDDFFRLGGDSVQAISLVAKACRIFHTNIPVSAFMREPTVAAFAAEIDRIRAVPRSGPPRASAPEPPAAIRQPPAVRQLPGLSHPAPPAPQEIATAATAATADVVLAIWREVLDAPDLGPDDNFFLMGGHSLKVTRVASRVRAAFGMEPPLRLLFTNPTAASFAAALDAMRNQAGEPATGYADPATALADLLDAARERADHRDRHAGGNGLSP